MFSLICNPSLKVQANSSTCWKIGDVVAAGEAFGDGPPDVVKIYAFGPMQIPNHDEMHALEGTEHSPAEQRGGNGFATHLLSIMLHLMLHMTTVHEFVLYIQ